LRSQIRIQSVNPANALAFFVRTVDLQGAKDMLSGVSNKGHGVVNLNLSSAEADILASIRPKQQGLTAMLLDWSAINTHSVNLDGLARFTGAAKETFAELPGTLEQRSPSDVQAVTANGEMAKVAYGQNLYVQVRPEAPVQVLLTGHMDTVFPATGSFQSPVWLDEATLNGPGVADMKGGLLVLLTALQALEQSPHAANLGYQIVLNSDEEVSSLGSAALLQESAAKAQIGLVYEPSALPDGTLAGARKGIGTYAIVARGLSAHAGRNPEEGRNAVAAIADFFVQAYALNGKREGLTINVARVDGGSATNVVPALAVGRFEARVWTHEDRHWVENALQDIRSRVARQYDLVLELHGAFNRPPKPMDTSTAALFAAVRLCGHDLGMTIDWRPSGGCCDGNNLAAAGLPVVDTLGVRGGAIHSPQEYMIADSLVERAQLSALLLMRLASGGIAVPPRITGAANG
jgi:glutamate carboxypeptidase